MTAKLIREAFEKGEGILRLAPNFVPRRFSEAGRRLRLHPDDYYALGTLRGSIKERWFSSVIPAMNGPLAPPDEGMSYVAPTDNVEDRFLFKDAVDELGAEIIGQELYEKYGTWPMYSKFFDYDPPLFFHLHLDDVAAARVGRTGKPEAYYFPPQLNNHPGQFPVTYFGLDPTVTKAQVRARLLDYEKRDTRMTELSRAYRLELGTGWYTPPGDSQALRPESPGHAEVGPWLWSGAMKKQNYERKNEKIRAAFLDLRQRHPERLERRLELSWSNWGFGMEPLADSAARLQGAGIRFIELHGNHFGPDLGYDVEETLQILGDHGLKVSGVCGIFSADNDLSSNRAMQRQAAIDYLRREIAFTAAVGGSYVIVVPGAVGRPAPYDDMEFARSVESLRRVADLFVQHHVRAAVEPIRSAEVSLVHTVAEVKRYLEAVDHPGVAHINGDVYHMQAEEAHIGEALLEAGAQLINVHVADSNRRALGLGSLDVDTIIMALYLIGFNTEGKYVTPEPLGPGGDPYPAMYGRPDLVALDEMVMQTARYFREREAELLA